MSSYAAAMRARCSLGCRKDRFLFNSIFVELMILQAVASGLLNVAEYLSAHVLTCLVPAFLIAGAITVFVRKDSVLRLFGSDVPKYKSYSVASVSGTILAVCSCTILPLFAGIYRRGSGIGPASAFLYSGPAINLLAVVYTARVLGLDLGVARAFAAIVLSILIGVSMSMIFRKQSGPAGGPRPRQRVVETSVDSGPSPLPLIALLVAVLVVGTWKMQAAFKMTGIFVIGAIAVSHLARSYTMDLVADWLRESWELARKIFPVLVLGTFVVGFVSYYLPPETFRPYLGGNSLSACFLGSVIGAILYMPTLLEVPIIGTTFGYNSGFMGFGPALSLLLAGPAVSLPSMLVLCRILGVRKTGVYILLVVVFSTLAGYLIGSYV